LSASTTAVQSLDRGKVLGANPRLTTIFQTE